MPSPTSEEVARRAAKRQPIRKDANGHEYLTAKQMPPKKIPPGIAALIRKAEQPTLFLCRNRKYPYYDRDKPRGGTKAHPLELDTLKDLRQLHHYTEAREIAIRGQFDGMGIAISGGLIGVDFDHILDADGNLIKSHRGYKLLMAMKQAGAYIEKSPSGTGLHALGYTTEEWREMPPVFIKETNGKKQVEVYARRRFFTLTGDIWQGCDGLEPADLTDFYYDAQSIRGASQRNQKKSRTQGDEGELAFKAVHEGALLEKALRSVPCDDRDEWMGVGWALKHYCEEFNLSTDVAKAMWIDASAKSINYGGEEKEGAKWDTDFVINRNKADHEIIHYPYIFTLADKYDPGWRTRKEENEEEPDVEEEDELDLSDIQKFLFSDADEAEAEVPITPIIALLLYADVAQFIAPGGIGKTTLITLLGIHIILGKDFMGYKIERPGPVVFFSREDNRRLFGQRFFKMLDDLNLTKEQRQQVKANFYMVDASSNLEYRLVNCKGSVLSHSESVDEIIERFKDVKPSMIVLDPAIRFGPGEAKVNDGEDMLVQAGKRICGKLDCAVMFSHHTGKESARRGDGHQYAGRGGSAFSDGCRMVFVCKKYFPDNHPCHNQNPTEHWPGIGSLSGNEVGYELLRPKNSYIPDEERVPVLFVRNGFGFRQVEADVRKVEMTLKDRILQAFQNGSVGLKPNGTMLSEQLEGGRNRNGVNEALSELVGEKLLEQMGKSKKDRWYVLIDQDEGEEMQ
ncbi:AAA family ATPase [Cupriavidus sp. amp6]|uniref:AAA family ATPase n=1 Tax=Cupriavidus sp. amp6 TaxID=388051 RepID=UPI00040E7144|nr:AAA family ATPase [Cupriavidus sp. amp6]